MSGVSHPPQQQPVVNTTMLLQPMPVPTTAGAPLFEGRHLDEFLMRMEWHAQMAGVNVNDLPSKLLMYCAENVKAVIRYSDEIAGKDWDKLKAYLKDLYGAGDEPVKYTVDDLRDFVKTSKNGREFTKRADLDRYRQEFLVIAGQLKKKQDITDNEMKLKFYAGLPPTTRAYVVTRLPDANKTASSPPSIDQVVKIIAERFNPTSIEYYSHYPDDEDQPARTSKPQVTTLPSAPVVEPIQLPSHNSSRSQRPSNDIDTLTQQLQQLTINHAQIMSQLQALSANSHTINTSTSTDKRCFICSQIGTHKLHPRHCPETAKLLAENLIVFIPDRQRYALPDGSDLPTLPYGSGGVAKYLREQRARTSSMNASTSVGSLVMMDTNPYQIETLNVSASEYEGILNGSAVTRTGKDTSARADPYKRPSDSSKSKDKSSIPPGILKNVNTPKPQQESEKPRAAPKIIPTAPPPAINTQDGWKQGRSGNDVDMKDARTENKKGAPQYYFTSDLQEQVNISDVQKKVLKQMVQIELGELIGISPPLQKSLSDSTKTRREYKNQQGEYDLYSQEAEVFVSRHAENDIETKRTLYVPDLDELKTFVIRHSNAVAVRPTKMLAMTTGTFSAKLAGVSVRCMIDTGSELNIIPERLLASATGLALNFEGSRWALKGINGSPVGLKGCCMDVNVTIGGYDFDHHFFVSREDMRNHDVILGQPWIQWYAAQINYDREGTMNMVVWQSGDRADAPTIQLQLTSPDDPRNVTTFKHTHTHQRRRQNQHVNIVDVDEDDEDF